MVIIIIRFCCRVWNTPRTGYPGAPIKEKFQKDGQKTTPTNNSPSQEFVKVTATFENTNKDLNMKNAKLFFGGTEQDQPFGDLGFNDPPVSVNTYNGHVWKVKVNDKTMIEWTISDKKGIKQTFRI